MIFSAESRSADIVFRKRGRSTMYTRETIRVREELDLAEEERRRIYRDNAVLLLKLKNLGWYPQSRRP